MLPKMQACPHSNIDAALFNYNTGSPRAVHFTAQIYLPYLIKFEK
jgi:hypothetical protein